uniref:Uncharacterized protein n=1 Tax=Mycena chlorophos TaxID=658473 RepID=A0ABQ0LA98_MYCCL|nr:predicted protein [Mycena chlorophos]
MTTAQAQESCAPSTIPTLIGAYARTSFTTRQRVRRVIDQCMPWNRDTPTPYVIDHKEALQKSFSSSSKSIPRLEPSGGVVCRCPGSVPPRRSCGDGSGCRCC